MYNSGQVRCGAIPFGGLSGKFPGFAFVSGKTLASQSFRSHGAALEEWRIWMNKRKRSTYRLVFTALMAALTYVCTLIRFPLLQSKVHLGNAAGILAGLILSPLDAGLASGLGAGLFDATLGGYDALGCIITFVSKFTSAFLCAVLFRRAKEAAVGKRLGAAYLSCAIGSLLYVILYMLKTFVMKQVVDGLALNAVFVVMLQKLPASVINAGFATLAAPPLYFALCPALDRMGISAKLK